MTTSIDTNQARVFITTYGIYNEGKQFASDLHGYWMDCEGIDLNQIHYDFEKLTGDEPEIMFTDFEGFPKDLYCESGIDFEKVQQWIDLDDDQKELLQIIMDHELPDFVEALAAIENYHVFEGTLADYAQEMGSDCYNISEMSHLANYIDWEAFGRDLAMDGMITEISHNQQLINYG